MQAAAEGAQDANGDGDGEDDDADKGVGAGGGFRVRADRVAPRAKRDPFVGIKDTRGIRATRYVLGLLHARFNHVSMEKAAERATNRFGD